MNANFLILFGREVVNMLLTVASSLTLPIRVISGSRLRVPDIVALLYVHCTLRRRQVGRVLRPLTEGLLRLVLPSLSLSVLHCDQVELLHHVWLRINS